MRVSPLHPYVGARVEDVNLAEHLDAVTLDRKSVV